MKNLGIILIVIGALALILCASVPAMNDMADQNFYTWGSLGLVVVGIILHIVLNKKFY